MKSPRIIAYTPPPMTCRLHGCARKATNIVQASNGTILGPYCPMHAKVMLEELRRFAADRARAGE